MVHRNSWKKNPVPRRNSNRIHRKMLFVTWTLILGFKTYASPHSGIAFGIPFEAFWILHNTTTITIKTKKHLQSYYMVYFYHIPLHLSISILRSSIFQKSPGNSHFNGILPRTYREHNLWMGQRNPAPVDGKHPIIYGGLTWFNMV